MTLTLGMGPSAAGIILWSSGSVLDRPWSGTAQVDIGALNQVRETGGKKVKVFVLMISDMIDHGVEAKKRSQEGCNILKEGRDSANERFHLSCH